MKFGFRLSFFAAMAAVVSGCGSDRTHDSGSKFVPIDTETVEFWDRQTTTTADLLQSIIDDFNGTHDGPPIQPVQGGNYGDIYRKTVASLKAGTLPGLAASYENMTAEYARSGAVAPLDPWIQHPELGLSQEELDDFFPAMLQTNTFAEFDDQVMSFPYTKSVLVMFYNKRVLRAAGINAPPTTWDAFLRQSRQIKKTTGKHAISLDVDCSTISGMIFSMGGEIISNGETHYDTKEALAVFKLIETLITEKLAYQNPPRTFNDETEFSNDETAFMLRTSAQWSYLEDLFQDHDAWGITRIPQADTENPRTVLYGGNITIFNTTKEQQETAWRFIKYFTSAEITARWSLGTGYLPVRRSAGQNADIQALWNDWPDNRVAFDCLEFSRPEPNVDGWQEIRGLVENAETAIITGMKSAQEAAQDLKNKADAVLKSRQR